LVYSQRKEGVQEGLVPTYNKRRKRKLEQRLEKLITSLVTRSQCLDNIYSGVSFKEIMYGGMWKEDLSFKID